MCEPPGGEATKTCTNYDPSIQWPGVNVSEGELYPFTGRIETAQKTLFPPAFIKKHETISGMATEILRNIYHQSTLETYTGFPA